MGIFEPNLDINGLIGRDVQSLAADYDDAVSDDPCASELIIAEHRAMEALLLSRATFLAPTQARAHAVALVPAAAMLCNTMEQVDALLEAARDWIDNMGDPARHAAAVTALRAMGEDVPEARMSLSISDAPVLLDVHDASTLVAMIPVQQGVAIVIGAVDLDEDGDHQDGDRRPTLTA